jgi:acetoin utilization protein AcuB
MPGRSGLSRDIGGVARGTGVAEGQRAERPRDRVTARFPAWGKAMPPMSDENQTEHLMSKPIPLISKHMTSTPHSIGSDQTIATAARMMNDHHIRHLPVLLGGRLLGILTDRDIKLIETFRDVDPTKITVEEAMTERPYTVSPEAPLDEVVETMAANKYGSAVIVQNQKVVGIFTTVDACDALCQLLRTRLAK